MAEPLRIIIVHERVGFGACCLEDIDFVVLGPTVEGIKARLEAALEAHFGEPMAYWIVSEPERSN